MKSSASLNWIGIRAAVRYDLTKYISFEKVRPTLVLHYNNFIFQMEEFSKKSMSPSFFTNCKISTGRHVHDDRRAGIVDGQIGVQAGDRIQHFWFRLKTLKIKN